MSASTLQGIRVVGGILPPGLLDHVMAGEVSDPATLRPASYHLVGRETVQDAVSRSWQYLLGAWTAWREQQQNQPGGLADTRAGIVREQWLLPLLDELGYGRVPPLPASLAVGLNQYPVSHAWQHVPIHLLGPGVDLDRRNPGVPGAARAPQAMVQELLNRSDDHLWALLSNGRKLRLLRDSTALAGSAHLEFDLEAIFDGELFAEFRLLWQICHVSRVEKRDPAGPPSDCTLEAWRGEAVDAGTRALERLRIGVETAIEALGTGFLTDPANTALRDDLAAGRLTTADYHRHLLRLVYRLLFLCVAEDRDLLLLRAQDGDDTTRDARTRYQRYFSTARLRRLARVRLGTSVHHDLWRAQRLVLAALGAHGEPALALPGLGGLFDPEPGSPDPFTTADLANDAFLTTMRSLGWVDIPGQRVQPVDYGNLDAEELGSVYESLLELVPRVDLAQRHFALQNFAGNERKTTGSYYTPTSLVNALLDTALDPVLDDAQKNATDAVDAEQRLLDLTVCDPACGSGHFLVAAARRIARRVASLRSGEDEPTPDTVRDALRDVIGRGIYGVDVNPLAADLAKVSLWLEAMEPGKPLGFLDARIRVGNSLLGTTPALLEGGVPDDAFKPLIGDDKAVAAAVRKRNKVERGGQEVLLFEAADTSTDALAERRQRLTVSSDTLEAVRHQADEWADYLASDAYRHRKTHADAWCAAFVWPLVSDAAQPPTDAVLRRIATEPGESGLSDTLGEVRRIAGEHRFFHWHLEFPEVFRVADGQREQEGPQGWAGGFDVVIGNPPWERVKLQEKEFFGGRAPEIANAPNAAARKKMIAALEISGSPADRHLFAEYHAELRRAAGESAFLRDSGCYPLGGVGDVNVYAVFADLALRSVAPKGRAGLILPTGLVAGHTYRGFVGHLVQTRTLIAYFGFENEDRLFSEVHNQYKYGLLTVAGRQAPVGEATFTANLRHPRDIHDAARRYQLTPEEIKAINPNTLTIPMFRWARDAEVMASLHTSAPVLVRKGDQDDNPWGVAFTRMLDMANDSHLFIDHADVEGRIICREGARAVLEDGRHVFPLYEGKMVWQYDHRYGTYEGQTQKQTNKGVLPHVDDNRHDDPDYRIQPRYWVEEKHVTWDDFTEREWAIGWRDVGPSERTLVASLIPATAAGDTFQLLFSGRSRRSVVALYGALASLAADYSARQRGSRMKAFVVEQIAVPTPAQLGEHREWLGGSAEKWLVPRVLELANTNVEMEPLARDLDEHGPPFRWIPERRVAIQAEIDAAVLHLYGLDRDQAEWLIDSFTVLSKYEERDHGEFRTKRLVLAAYDAMQKARTAGVRYETPIDPPPGHGPRHPAKEITQ